MCAAALTLCGCSTVKNPEALGQSVQELYASVVSMETDMQVEANLGTEVMDYTLHGVYEDTESGGRTVLTVQQPEVIAGVTATVEGDGLTVSYDATELETGMPEHAGATPIDVLPGILNDLRNAAPQAVWQQQEGTLGLRYENTTDEGTCTEEIYLATDGGALQRAVLYWNDTQVLQCTFENVMIKK